MEEDIVDAYPDYSSLSKKRKSEMEFDRNSFVHNNSTFNNKHNNGGDMCNQLQQQQQQQQHQCLRNNSEFLYLSPQLNVYHAELVINQPYPLTQKREETLYLPLTENIFVNMKSYEEISFKNGPFFLANSNGFYDRTVEATAINLLKYCEREKRLYIARSFVFPDKKNVEEISKQLFGQS